MPVFGTFKADPAKLGSVKELAVDKVDIEAAQTLTFTFEVLVAGALAVLPPALHPPFPTYCTLAVRRHEDGPYGAFTLAELRLHARAGAHYVGFNLGGFCDNAKAAAWLANAYGAPIAAAETVTLAKRHYGYEAKVVAGGKTVLDAVMKTPGFISGADVLYVQNSNMAALEGAAVLVGQEFEHHIAEARRGEAAFKTLDLAAFGAGGLTTSNHLPSTWTSGTWSYMPVRFVIDPDKPAMAGTRKIGQKAPA